MTVTVNPSEGKVQMERSTTTDVIRFYASEITGMSNRAGRFGITFALMEMSDVAEEMHRISDELDEIARRLEGRA